MTTVSIAPTPSRWASAAAHLDRRADWRTVRIGGERYVVLASATSGKTYTARADAAGCSCPWYQKTGQRCSHLLALELAATEGDLAAQPAPAPEARPSYNDLFAVCDVASCDEDRERGECYCSRHTLVDAF